MYAKKPLGSVRFDENRAAAKTAGARPPRSGKAKRKRLKKKGNAAAALRHQGGNEIAIAFVPRERLASIKRGPSAACEGSRHSRLREKRENQGGQR